MACAQAEKLSVDDWLRKMLNSLNTLTLPTEVVSLAEFEQDMDELTLQGEQLPASYYGDTFA